MEEDVSIYRMRPILTSIGALEYFGTKLNGEVIKDTKYLNNNRHFLLTTDKCKYYILFKKEFFMKFNDYFPAFVSSNPEYHGLGETINIEWLNKAIELEADYLIFVYPDYKCYFITPLIFKNFAEKHGLIRTQEIINVYNKRDYSGDKEIRNETEYVIPISLLMRFDKND